MVFTLFSFDDGEQVIWRMVVQTNNGYPTVDCADRINKFEEQQPSLVDAEIEKKSSL